MLGLALGVRQAVDSGAGIGDSCIRNDRSCLVVRNNLTRPLHGCGTHAIGREHSGDGVARAVVDDQR